MMDSSKKNTQSVKNFKSQKQCQGLALHTHVDENTEIWMIQRRKYLSCLIVAIHYSELFIWLHSEWFRHWNMVNVYGGVVLWGMAILKAN